MNTEIIGGAVIGAPEPGFTLVRDQGGKTFLAPYATTVEISNEACEKIANIVVKKISEAMTAQREGKQDV